MITGTTREALIEHSENKIMTYIENEVEPGVLQTSVPFCLENSCWRIFITFSSKNSTEKNERIKTYSLASGLCLWRY